MPQYLFSVHHDKNETKMSPEREQQAYADTGIFNEKLKNQGHFVYANGIFAPEEAILVDNRNNEKKITKETFIKGDRYLGGFWIVDFENEDDAKTWALEASNACQQSVEIRRFH